MKYQYTKRFLTLAATLIGTTCILTSGAFADQGGHANATAATTVTGATGTIAQLNYDEGGGSAEGFLVGTNTLLTFPGTVCAGVASLGVAGNAVTYSGTAITYSSGFSTVSVTSFTNNTTNVTWTKPTATKPAAYGPVSGTITQLNYANNGSVNGFVMTPTTGSKVFVDIGPLPNSTLAPLLKTGAAVSVTGTSESAPLCAPAGTPVEVDASAVTIGTTTVTLGHVH